jgi:hypothetical protein
MTYCAHGRRAWCYALVDRVHDAYQTARYIEAAGLLPSVTDTVDALATEAPANERREALRLKISVAIRLR